MGNNRDNSSSNESELIGLLGGVPHTIRGSLWNYDMQLTITHRFTSCTACSVSVIEEYKNRGLGFVLDACNVPNYLEKLSGLERILSRPDLDEVHIFNEGRMIIVIHIFVTFSDFSCVMPWIT